MPHRRSRRACALFTMALTGCNLSPLQNRIAVGEDAFVAFVGEEAGGRSDIFAGVPAGGELSRITFTPVAESHPALTAQGGLIAFIRHPPAPTTAPPQVVVMNLLNGAEREIEVPARTGSIDGLAWDGDGSALYLRGTSATWRIPFPLADRAPIRLEGTGRAAADSALDVLLGAPAFARAGPCDSGGVCVVGPDGTPTMVSPTGRDPFRWGRDSLAWFEEDRIVVRPLGPGAVRIITWQQMPANIRQGSYAWRVARRTP